MTLAEVIGSAESIGLSADECLKCNVCNTACPVLRVTDAFPGPKYVGPQAQRFRLGVQLAPRSPTWPQLPSPDVTVDLCSGCGWCTTVCPAGVKIAEINNRSRAARRAPATSTGPLTWRRRLRDRLLSDTDLLGHLGVPTAPLANSSLRSRAFRALIQLVIGIHRRAPLPTFARRSFRTVWKRRGGLMPASPEVPGLPPPDRAVVYFHGCAANYQEPHLGETAAAVLERNGYALIVPPQVCCGLPFISNGLYAQAREHARRNIASLAAFARAGYRIVGTSTSCTHALKAEYRDMLDLDDADARAVSEATWDICEFLLDLHDQGRLDTGFGRLEGPLPYHAPCQLRSHGIGLPALDLFALVPGLEAVDLDHDCCGVCGTYGLKEERYDIAMAVGADLFRKVRESGAPAAACDSETCRWQIEQATGTRTRHPIEFLADAYAAGDIDARAHAGHDTGARADAGADAEAGIRG